MGPRSVKRRSTYDRLAALERRIWTLTWVVAAQTILLAIMTISYVLQLTRNLVILLLLAVPSLVLFRRQLPSWLHRIRRLWARPSRQSSVNSPNSQLPKQPRTKAPN